MSTDKPLQKLHIGLMKTNVRQFDEMIEEGVDLSRYTIRRGIGFSGRLFISPPNQSPPNWLTFVQTGISEKLRELTNRTNTAVLAIRRSNRIFAFTFGHGRHLIRTSAIVPDFGLKTALNALQYDSLRSTDSFTIDERTIHTRAQASRVGGIEVFGIDVGHDILRAVTGTPRINVPIQSISGTEFALAVSVHTDFTGLGQLCDLLLTLYRKRNYKDHFAWIDNIRRVSDPATLANLNNLLIAELQRKIIRNLYLAPPEPVDWEDIQGFNYTHRRRTIDPNMQLESYLENINAVSLSVDNLRQDQVFAYQGDETEPSEHWPIYNCLVFETTMGSKHYILTTATWFEIDRDFSSRIANTLANIPVARVKLPKVRTVNNGKLEHEGDYNTRVAQADNSKALLDKTSARCRATSSGIEPCDLFTGDREFIHVKHKKGGSSSLSHLFAQGRVSAEALLGDQDFRQDIRQLLQKIKPALRDSIPVERPAPGDYGVVFAILGAENARPGAELPFFSQLNLARTYESLTSLGFRVSAIGVPAE